jgi:calcineurin-like phosphoesterase family protein
MGQASKKYPMTNWYNPVMLVATAIRVVISTIFGEFADRREAIAAANAIQPQPFDSNFDYSSARGDFWFDFLADTGDGWNSTYAMARLASQPAIELAGAGQLPRGKFLVLGGDEVYPVASREAYDQKFLAPFDEAYSPARVPLWKSGEQDLYAIPGNHDWYDGLSSFFGLFCRRRARAEQTISFPRPGRVVAGRQTKQTRSYFALKLPGKWWLWATDAQLEGYIDQPQVDYFQQAAQEWMEPGSKVILCIDGPRWQYADPRKPEPKFENFSYVERIPGAAAKGGKPLGHELKLILTGDSHHYSRYTEEDRQYVTAGGGGAFLHPTHHLKKVNSFKWHFPPPGEPYDRAKRDTYSRSFTLAKKADGSEAVFPSRAKSRALAFWNLGFAGINYWFTLTLFFAYAMFDWLLDFNARMAVNETLPEALQGGSLLHAICSYWNFALFSPAAVILIALAVAGYVYAADTTDSAGFKLRIPIGIAHAAVQAAVVTISTCWVIRALGVIDNRLEIGIAAAASAVLSATAYGLYLLFMLNMFGFHWNEGFSSFAHRGFKNMLRIRIAPDGTLTIFPIGLKRTPSDRSEPPRNPPLKPELIEGPIQI